MGKSQLLSLAILALLTIVSPSNICWAPDGTTPPDQVPCPLVTSTLDGRNLSICCVEGDLCLSNGLCKAPKPEVPDSNIPDTYYRGGCAQPEDSPAWDRDHCPLFCTGLDEPRHKLGDDEGLQAPEVVMIPCDEELDTFMCADGKPWPSSQGWIASCKGLEGNDSYFIGTGVPLATAGASALTTVAVDGGYADEASGHPAAWFGIGMITAGLTLITGAAAAVWFRRRARRRREAAIAAKGARMMHG